MLRVDRLASLPWKAECNARNIILPQEMRRLNDYELQPLEGECPLARVFVDKSANTIEWFEQRGSEFTDHSPWHVYRESYHQHFVKGGGAALLKILLDKTKERRSKSVLKRRLRKFSRMGRIEGVIERTDLGGPYGWVPGR
jgi:hypothetical protein